jgi:hypothetical protein
VGQLETHGLRLRALLRREHVKADPGHHGDGQDPGGREHEQASS